MVSIKTDVAVADQCTIMTADASTITQMVVPIITVMSDINKNMKSCANNNAVIQARSGGDTDTSHICHVTGSQLAGLH